MDIPKNNMDGKPRRAEFAKIDPQLYEQTLQSMVFSAIDRIIKNKPDRVACYNDVHNPADTVTYVELKERSLAIAAFLHSKGLQKGANAALVLPNCWEFVASWLSLLFQGMCFTGIYRKYGKRDTRKTLKKSLATVVFVDSKSLEKIRLVKRTDGAIKYIVVVDAIDGELEAGEFSFDEILRTNVDHTRTPVQVQPDDVAYMPFSSGTTGEAKGILHTQRSLVALLLNTDANQQAFWESAFKNTFDWSAETVILISPIVHAFCFYLMMLFLRKGTSLVMIKEFDASEYCKAVQTHKVRLALFHPLRIREVLKLKNHGYDLSSIEWVLAGGAALSRSLVAEMRERWPHVQHIHPVWGMTELMGPLIKDLRFDEPLSVGRGPPGVEVKIIDGSGQSLPRGEIGQLCVRTPTLMKGYSNHPEATAKVVVDGWMHTGDVGYLNEDGCECILGRDKEIMKLSDDSVFPCELEDALLADPRVRDVAVLGIPASDEPADGELPRAYVVKADPGLTEQDVVKIVADNLATYKGLTGGAIFVTEIPRTVLGKINYAALRQMR